LVHFFGYFSILCFFLPYAILIVYFWQDVESCVFLIIVAIACTREWLCICCRFARIRGRICCC